jgi:hypothetical protein
MIAWGGTCVGVHCTFMVQSETRNRILMEVLCRWVRGEQEQRYRHLESRHGPGRMDARGR